MMSGKSGAVSVGIAAIVICGIVIGGVRAQSATAPQTASPAGPKKAEEQFKNIQVLKGIPADQLIPAMQFITASLGVECEFCHVQGAFEKDDNHSQPGHDSHAIPLQNLNPHFPVFSLALANESVPPNRSQA